MITAGGRAQPVGSLILTASPSRLTPEGTCSPSAQNEKMPVTAGAGRARLICKETASREPSRLAHHCPVYPRHDWLVKAVGKRLREEVAKLQVEINEEKSRILDLAKGGGSFTCTPSRTSLLKAGASKDSRYLPTGRSGTVNCPISFEMVA